MMACSTIRSAAVACFLATWWGAVTSRPNRACASGFTLTRVVDRNTLVPGTNQGFGYLWLPALDGGNLAFAGGPFIGTGIYKRVNGQVLTVADGSTRVPGEPFTFEEGSVSFTGMEPQIAGTTTAFAAEPWQTSTAIYWDQAGSLSTVIDHQTPIPYGDPQNPSFHQPPENWIVLQNNQFQLTTTGVSFSRLTMGFNPDNLAEPCLIGLQGVYRGTSTGLELVADNSEVARCRGSGFFTLWTQTALVGGQRAAFTGTRINYQWLIADGGLYVRDLTSGSDQLVATRGTAVADSDVTLLARHAFEPRQLGPDYLDFVADGTAGRGAYRYRNGLITTIFDGQSTLPGPDIGPWSLSNISFNGDHFAVSLANDATGVAAVYSNLGGDLARVIGTGDVLNGEPVALAAAGAYGLSGNQLAVLVAQASGFSIYLATPTPDPLVGDANVDCTVGTADYAIWAAQFGQSGTGLSADFDGNGSVEAGDYALWAANFGRTCPQPLTTSVPEPTTAALGIVGLAGFLLQAARWSRRCGVDLPALCRYGHGIRDKLNDSLPRPGDQR